MVRKDREYTVVARAPLGLRAAPVHPHPSEGIGRRTATTGGSRVQAARTILTASVPIAAGAALLATTAQAQAATGTVTCTGARIDHTRFPIGPQSASWTPWADDVLVQSWLFALKSRQERSRSRSPQPAERCSR
jgi:hypothetical protein